MRHEGPDVDLGALDEAQWGRVVVDGRVRAARHRQLSVVDAVRVDPCRLILREPGEEAHPAPAARVLERLVDQRRDAGADNRGVRAEAVGGRRDDVAAFLACRVDHVVGAEPARQVPAGG